ncbi:hypothetical protein CK203_103758 [Vitis vinifera]|uniref:Uncharacterized protein n=1 Tax=Vitis vinifera TaxID=29760 RepID=A0A438ELA9_VITVI|nr:hypothetical protein CK203_103758 [Vitis vinifera]
MLMHPRLWIVLSQIWRNRRKLHKADPSKDWHPLLYLLTWTYILACRVSRKHTPTQIHKGGVSEIKWQICYC